MKSLLLKYPNFKELFIILLILVVTFGYYLDSNIPEGLVEIKLFNLKIKSYHYEDIGIMIYIIKMKVYIIALSIIWYLTSKHWWKSSILVVITIEILKLISSFNPNQRYMDEIEYYTSLPISIPIVLILIYISNKLNTYNLAKEVRTQIDVEIDELFYELRENEIDDIEGLKNSFIKVKNNKHSLSQKDYLKKLIAIRDSFYET